MAISSNLVLKCAHGLSLAGIVATSWHDAGLNPLALGDFFPLSPIVDGSGCSLSDFDQDQLMRE
jgi:hypothetical protein